MNRVIFKELLIADIENKEAKIVRFVDGKNLLTSHANHVGKSLICKSLYYTLGAEVFFSDAWKKVNSLYWLRFCIDNKEYRIVRRQSLFAIQQPNGTTISFFKTKTLSEYLNGLFDMDIKLVAKDTEQSFVSTAPVFMYLPYYIDQENGWTPSTISFDRLSQFDKPQRKNSLFYHLGCFDGNYVKIVLARKECNKKHLSLSKEQDTCSSVVSYLQDYLEKHVDIPANDTELNQRISSYRQQLDTIFKHLETTRNKIVDIENKRARAEREKEIIQNFIKKETKKKPAPQNVQCPQCGHNFSIDFEERFKKEYFIETITEDLAGVVESIKKYSEALVKLNKEFEEYSKQLHAIETIISSDKATYDEYIKVNSSKLMLRDNKYHLGELTTEMSTISEQIKELDRKIKRYDDDKEQANNLYRYFLSILFTELNISSQEVQPDSFSIGDEIEASGAYKDRTILAKYYAFLRTKKSLNDSIIKFPLVIDSPRGDEQDKQNSIIIMNSIIGEKKLDNQVIVSTIDGDEYISKDNSLNVILLENEQHHLLSSEDYRSNEDEIINALSSLANS